MFRAIGRLSPILQILGLSAIGLLSMAILLSIVTATFYVMGADMDALSSAGNLSSADTQQILMLKVMQIAQAIGLFITPYVIYRYGIRGTSYDLVPQGQARTLGLVFFVGMLAAFPFITYMAEWNAGLNFPIESINQWMHQTEAQAERLIKLFLAMDHVGDLLFNLFLIALLPAVGEELLFRGTIQPLLNKTFKGRYHFAIWATAFVFSFIHLQFLGFFPRLILGAMLGYAAHWTGSLWAPMLGHFANNALAVILAYIIGPEFLDSDAEIMSAEMSWLYAVPSFMLLMACMYYLSQNRVLLDSDLDDSSVNQLDN